MMNRTAPRFAKVTRGVHVRGDPKAPGTMLAIVARPVNTDQITPIDFYELRASNYVIGTDSPPAAKVASQSTNEADTLSRSRRS